MGFNIQKKEQIVAKFTKIVEVSLSAIVASFEGMRVNEINSLRNICRKHGVYVCVVRNRLMYRVFSNSVFKVLHSVLFGSNIVAFSTIEATDCIKIFVKFSKENVNFKIRGVVFDGVFIDGSNIDFLSSLPSYKGSIVNLIFVMRESILGRLIRLLRVLCENKKCRSQ